MLVQIIIENGVKKIKPLTADAGAGAPVGTVIAMYKKSNPSGFLYLDGRDTTGTSEELSTHYPLLYAYLGSNILPDYREFALVGAEENTTDVYNASTNPTGTIHDHDIYTEGQAKDDQFQDHNHTFGANNLGSTHVFGAVENSNGIVWNTGEVSSSFRKGSVTRGKRKAVYFYIKATSGLSENAQDNVVAQINEQRSYSTEEHWTGKYWIDGSKIYSVTIPFTMPTSETYINIDTTQYNIRETIKYEIVGNSFTSYYESDTDKLRAWRLSAQYMQVYCGAEYPTRPFNANLYLEYVKTTD